MNKYTCPNCNGRMGYDSDAMLLCIQCGSRYMPDPPFTDVLPVRGCTAQVAPARDVQSDKIAVYEELVQQIERELRFNNSVNNTNVIEVLRNAIRSARQKLNEIDAESEVE